MMRNWPEARLAVTERRWEAAFAAFDTCYSIVSQAAMRWHQARIREEWARPWHCAMSQAICRALAR